MADISKINCCFCKKEILVIDSHSTRPIDTMNGNRCCEQCNIEIVIPTRLVVWKTEDTLRVACQEKAKACKDISEQLLKIYKDLSEV